MIKENHTIWFSFFCSSERKCDQMANKLSKMTYTSVDLCKRGANPKADIKLFKSRDGQKTRGGETEMGVLKTAEGQAFDMSFAFYESMASIMADPKLNSIKKSRLMKESLEEFNEAVAKTFDDWAEDQTVAKSEELSETRLIAMQDVIAKFDTIIKAAMEDEEDEETDDEEDDVDDEGEKEEKPPVKLKGKIPFKKGKCKEKIEKGGVDIMAKIDITKMSAEDKATLEAIEKKYGVEEEEQKQEPVKKEEPAAPVAPEMHPDVKKALEEVADLKKSIEMQGIEAIAKKYEVIGKKAEELAPKLYDLKKSGGTAYTDYIGILDELVTTSANSGIFKEIGSNHGAGASDLNGLVTEIRKAMPELTYEQAVVKAYENNPGLDHKTGKLK